MMIDDTCAYCESWNVRMSTDEQKNEIHYFCRDCGESWVDLINSSITKEKTTDDFDSDG